VTAASKDSVSVATGVKCPYCPGGVFRWHSTASTDEAGNERQGGYWRCTALHSRVPAESYDPATAQGHGGYWAVVDGRVTVVRTEW
jgi:hypothetical protein